MIRLLSAAASAALMVLLVLPTAHAAGPGVVELADGRQLEVAGVRDDGEGRTALDLPGGGSMVFPAGIVKGFRPLPDAAWVRDAGDLATLIEAAALRHRLHPELLAAVARVESGFDVRAVSPKGAGGVLQLMPATARRFGVRDRFDPAQNVEAGARYLSWLLDRYGDRVDLALAGYNAGEGAVDRHSGVPPYRETLLYVHKVLEHAARYGLETHPVR